MTPEQLPSGPALSSVTGGLARLSGLAVEDLLEELRVRAGTVQAAQDRMAALLDAVVVVSSDLELSAVLRRIVQAAIELVDATYGALGVIGPGGEELIEFVTLGIDDEQRARIGPEPHGKGLLGMIITSPHPQRVDCIADHPDSFGFPANHPVMTSFMGAPVRIRDTVYGNLYLTDKRGSETFSAADEGVLTALAAAAGVAIDNARLYERTRMSQHWADASREVVSALLQGRSESEVLTEATEHLLELTGAPYCMIAVPREADLVVVASAGGAPHPVGAVVTDPSWLEALAQVAQQSVLDTSTTTVVPLIVPGQRALGLLVVGALETANPVLGEALAEFAQRLAVGLTAADSQEERARAELLEDRDRIARDMHDHVIQRLFATGLSLQSAGRSITEVAARDRIEGAVDEIDAVIKDIRHTIFALHRAPGPRSLTAEISGVCDAAHVTLGFAPSLTIQGPTGEVPDHIAADLLAVVREGLSNAARHAHASVVGVRVSVGPQLTVQVTDNGRGVPDDVGRSGLDNLARRASTRGGSFEIRSAEGGGTQLVWQVPRDGA